MKDNVSKILPIYIQKDFNATLGLAFPLCIILASDKFYGWYFENYTMPYARLNAIDYFECGIFDAIEYGSKENINTRLLRFSYIGKNLMSQVENIHYILKERIQEEYYSILFIDHYYLPEMPIYTKIHFAHEVLIYGYSDEERIYYVLAFLNNQLKKFSITYETMEEAYKGAFLCIDNRPGWSEKMYIQLRCVGHTESYPIDLNKFKKKIQNYCLTLLDDSEYYLHLLYMNKTPDNEISYGICITDTFLNYVLLMKKHLKMAASDIEIKEIFTQYYPFHVYADFHKGLYKRFLFYSQKLLDNKYVNEYEMISLEAEKIRLLFIKCIMKSTLKNKQNIYKYINLMETHLLFIKNNEKRICENIMLLL